MAKKSSWWHPRSRWTADDYLKAGLANLELPKRRMTCTARATNILVGFGHLRAADALGLAETRSEAANKVFQEAFRSFETK